MEIMEKLGQMQKAMTREEQIKKIDAMAKPRSEEAVKKAEERKKQREYKDLLFRDLCARLPYSPICHIVDENGVEIDDILTTSTINHFDVWVVEPYLRPLSSMTKEEVEEYHNLCFEEEREVLEYGEWVTRVYHHDTIHSIDWLNKKMFDIRELIPKGLALEAAEGIVIVNNSNQDV